MKKIFLSLLIFTFMFLSPNFVKADDIFVDYQLSEQEFIPLNQIASSDSNYQSYINAFNPNLDKLYLYSDFSTFYNDSKNRVIFDNLYDEISKYKNHKYRDVEPNYRISVAILSSSSSSFKLNSVILAIDLTYTGYNAHYRYSNAYVLGTYYDAYRTVSELDGNGNFNYEPKFPFFNTKFFSFSPFHDVYTSDDTSYKVYYPLFLFETNYSYVIKDTLDTYEIYDSDGNLKESYSAGDERPVYFPNGFSSSGKYNTVNLNNYSHIYLIPKDYYSDPFTTKLSYNGSICLSAQYGYGEKEKNNGVSDNCTKRVSEYTDVTFAVSQTDLDNKAIYLIETKDTTYDNFLKYDSSLFDIAFISKENRNNPEITVNGKTYYPIGPDNLTSSAKKNDEANIISGSSCTVGDLNCQSNSPHSSSLSDIANNVTDTLSSVWSSITTFMSLFTKFFNTLPVEIRVISITTFTTACILGIIKILKA